MAYTNFGSLPVYRKALELCHMSREIASYVTFNKNLRKLYQSASHRDTILDSLLTDAILIPKKIALAETTASPSERLQIATYINIIIRNINSYCRGLEHDGVKETEYLDLLRNELRSFRKSFRTWSNNFSKE